MSIVSSTFSAGHAQLNGSRHVTEMHTDSDGVVHERIYLASPGTDYAAVAAAYAVVLAARLAEAEANALLGGL